MIEAFRLGAQVRGAILFDGIDLAFRSGEAWVVAGPPSCGKSLLFDMLRGERRPDAGEVSVDGVSLYRNGKEARRGLRASSAYLPESLAVPDSRTVDDLFGLSAMAAPGIPHGERRARETELLGLLGLAGAEGHLLSSLSASERTRAVLAAELLRGPRTLFLDMALMNAGPPWYEPLLGLFRALAREGRTVLLAERAVPERLRGIRNVLSGRAGPFALLRFHAEGQAAGTPRILEAEGFSRGAGETP